MGVVEDIRAFGDLIRKYNDIELNRQIVSLENEVLDLSRDKRRLEDQVESLQQSLRFSGQLKFKRQFYWIEGDNTPFCPGCWESKKMAIHLADNPQNFAQMTCPSCKHIYVK
jgi:hypothetical protein